MISVMTVTGGELRQSVTPADPGESTKTKVLDRAILGISIRYIEPIFRASSENVLYIDSDCEADMER